MNIYRSTFIPGILAVALLGTLLAPPELQAQFEGRPYISDCIELSPQGFLNFGVTPINTPTEMTVTVSNKRSTPIMLDRVEKNEGHFFFYTIVSPLPVQIAGGGSQQVTVRFHPTGTHSPEAHLSSGLLFRFDGLGVDTNICRYVFLHVTGHASTASAVDEAGSAALGLYPNPAHTKLTVSLEDTRATTAVVFDLLGREVLRASVEGQAELDVSKLPAGAYVLSAGGTVRRFVVE